MSKEDKELEDVLYAFSVEPSHDEETLRRYLNAYPKYAEDLLDLLHEVRITETLASIETDSSVDAKADQAWRQFTSRKPVKEAVPSVAVFANKLRGRAFVALANALNVPREFLIAFRDRLVIPGSIPKSFVARLAKAAEVETQAVLEYLTGPPQLTAATQFKSDYKPEQQGQVTFKELIQATDMNDETRQNLLKESGVDGSQ